MIHVAIPYYGFRLLRCAIGALAETMTQPYAVDAIANDDPRLAGETFTRPQMGSYTNGRKLDVALASLPHDAQWLFAMHDDSAPLAVGFLDWLQERIGDGVCGGFMGVGVHGLPHPSGALYRVAWLRDTKASFVPRPSFDVAAGLTVPVVADSFIAARATNEELPWWLRHTDAALDYATGDVLYAHLGGGFLGATSRRLPTWAWPTMVWWHLL